MQFYSELHECRKVIEFLTRIPNEFQLHTEHNETKYSSIDHDLFI